MDLPKIPRYTRYEKLITFIVLVFLITHAFFPKFVNIDRYTIILLSILILIAILPTVYSAKLPYILEVKRKLNKAKENAKNLSQSELNKIEKDIKRLHNSQEDAVKGGYISKSESERLVSLSNDVLEEIKKAKE